VSEEQDDFYKTKQQKIWARQLKPKQKINPTSTGAVTLLRMHCVCKFKKAYANF